MKVAVYMGSFNPMHIGHIAVIRYLLERGLFDKVYVVVSPRNPFKDSSVADSGEKRLQAAKRSVEKQGFGSRVSVEDIEFGMALPSYSIDTLDALQKREPQNSFTLVIGGDNLGQMLRWREGSRILTQYGIAVYPREGYDLKKEAGDLASVDKNFRITLLEAPMVNVSSTQIRQKMNLGEDISGLIA